jgi:hypothetical protein
MSASFRPCEKKTHSFQQPATILVSVFVLMAGGILAGQTATPTDLKFHKFQPKVAPEQPASSANTQVTPPNGISLAGAQQIQLCNRKKLRAPQLSRKLIRTFFTRSACWPGTCSARISVPLHRRGPRHQEQYRRGHSRQSDAVPGGGSRFPREGRESS